jgi:alcohol dehydrogenase class IV
VVRFNAAADATRFRPLAEALGVRGASRLADDEVGDALAARLGDLAASVGAPRTLSSIGVTEDQIEGFARQTLCDACLTTRCTVLLVPCPVAAGGPGSSPRRCRSAARPTTPTSPSWAR